MAYLKPQSPLQHKDGDYFYPLTTIDQVVMEDGSRLNSVFKHTVRINITLLASNWSFTAPYTQTIALDDYIDNLKVDANIVYGGIEETDLELNKAASCLSYIKKNGKNVIFYCLSSKPEIDIPVEIAYESVNSIATVGTSEKIDLNEELAEQAELIGELQTTLQSKMSGNNLNFEIVGGLEQPTNPKENMIWVNTSTAISSWIFSADEPTNPVEGMVWFLSATTSSIKLEAIKENNIYIYPASAMQYINGVWASKIPMIYQNSVWKDFYLWLYNYGDECLAVTGQWIAKGMSASAQYPNKAAPNVTKNADSVKITGVAGVNGGVFYAKNKINLTGFKELVFEGTISHKDSALQIWTEFGSYTSSNVVAKTETAFTDSSVSIPISNLNGEYIIGFKFYSNSSVTMKSLKLI